MSYNIVIGYACLFGTIVVCSSGMHGIHSTPPTPRFALRSRLFRSALLLLRFAADSTAPRFRLAQLRNINALSILRQHATAVADADAAIASCLPVAR